MTARANDERFMAQALAAAAKHLPSPSSKHIKDTPITKLGMTNKSCWLHKKSTIK